MAGDAPARSRSRQARQPWLAPLALAAAALLAGCAGAHAGGTSDDRGPAASATTAPPRACTEIGCQSSLTMKGTRLAAILAGRRPLTVTACLDRDCVTHRVPAGRCAGLGARIGDGLECADRTLVVLPPPSRQDMGSGSHSARLTLASGAAVLLDERVDGIRFTRFAPNGPGCPPTCWIAVVRL